MERDQQAESSSGQRIAKKPSKELSAVVADWLTLYAQTYREEITEELALLYQQALREVRPDILHKAFLRAAKNCKFRPTPAEVLDAAVVEYEREPVAQEPEETPPTHEERAAAVEAARKDPKLAWLFRRPPR